MSDPVRVLDLRDVCVIVVNGSLNAAERRAVVEAVHDPRRMGALPPPPEPPEPFPDYARHPEYVG